MGTESPSVVFPDVIDVTLWDEMARNAAPFARKVRRLGLLDIEPRPAALSEPEIKRILAKVRKRLPAYLKAAGRRALNREEVKNFEHEISAFLRQATSEPVVDGPALRRADALLGIRTGVVDGRYFLTLNSRPALLLNTTAGSTLQLSAGGTVHEASGVATAAFIVDLLIEVFSIVFGIVGITLPAQPDHKAIEKLCHQLFRSEAAQDALLKLLKAIKDGDVKGVFAFFEFLEGSGNLLEFFAHFFAGLGYWDYVITIGKILAWIAAGFASGGAAVAVKAVNLALDIIGLAVKCQHANEAH